MVVGGGGGGGGGGVKGYVGKVKIMWIALSTMYCDQCHPTLTKQINGPKQNLTKQKQMFLPHSMMFLNFRSAIGPMPCTINTK